MALNTTPVQHIDIRSLSPAQAKAALESCKGEIKRMKELRSQCDQEIDGYTMLAEGINELVSALKLESKPGAAKIMTGLGNLFQTKVTRLEDSLAQCDDAVTALTESIERLRPVAAGIQPAVMTPPSTAKN